MRHAEAKDLSRLPPAVHSSSVYPARKGALLLAAQQQQQQQRQQLEQDQQAGTAGASFLLQAGPHPPLPSHECLTPTGAYTVDPKLAPPPPPNVRACMYR